MPSRNPTVPVGLIPERYADYYLSNAPSLSWLVFANAVAVLVGVRYYVATMPGISTFLWPLYADSPAAVFLMALALATLLPNIGRSPRDLPRNRPLAYLHTFAFVWLVKYGLWTAFVLNLHFSAYYPDLWGYFGILFTHLGFVAEAYLLPHAAGTTRGALAAALVALLANDAVDYLFGLHPPLRFEPGLALPVGTVVLSVLAVALAARAFPRLGEQSAA
ncbi:MAG: DUF1405 domain-containing protein [Haloarculaceae archaeon]